MMSPRPLLLAVVFLLSPAGQALFAQSPTARPDRSGSSQIASTPPSWSIVPRIGFGVARETGQWGSAGAEAGVALEYGGADWRGGADAVIRGVGVGCGDPCFIEGGPTVGLGVARSLGDAWVGAGANFLHQSSDWQVLPYAGLSLDLARLRLGVRVELPVDDGAGVYVPITLGVPIRLNDDEP